GFMLALEGAEPMGEDSEMVEIFCALGVRMVGLTWNRRNVFADGLGEDVDGGLSRAGRGLVNELIRHNVMIDLAHASDRTFFDILDCAPEAVVVVSHACCRAVWDSPRNLSDEQ